MGNERKTTEVNPQLEALFRDEAEIVDGLLRERLDPLLGLSRDIDKIIPKAAFTRLSYRQRVIACLIARHAMTRAGVPGASVEADPTKVSQQGLIPLARCREQLSRLKAGGSGIVDSNDSGYFVPTANLLVALEELVSVSGHKD